MKPVKLKVIYLENKPTQQIGEIGEDKISSLFIGNRLRTLKSFLGELQKRKLNPWRYSTPYAILERIESGDLFNFGPDT